MTHRFIPLFPVVVAALTLAGPTARAQVSKAEGKPGPGVTFEFPKAILDGMRREVETKARADKAKFDKSRAIPPPFVEAVVGAPVAQQMVQALPANAAVAQQWTPRIRQILRVEYQFLRAACIPTVEQRKPIASAGLASLDDAGKKYAEWLNNRNKGVVRIVNGRAVRDPVNDEGSDPRKILLEAMLAAAKESLTPGQYDRYRSELDARSEDTKRVAILNLVSKLDYCLFLSPEQREKIEHALSSRWDGPWPMILQYSSLDQLYFPMIPDEFIVTSLSAEQKKVWASTQKIMFSPFNTISSTVMDLGPLDDEFPDEAVKVEPKPESDR